MGDIDECGCCGCCGCDCHCPDRCDCACGCVEDDDPDEIRDREIDRQMEETDA